MSDLRLKYLVITSTKTKLFIKCLRRKTGVFNSKDVQKAELQFQFCLFVYLKFKTSLCYASTNHKQL